MKKFDKITLSLGGHSSRYYGKSGFNIKIRGKKDLYGRNHFKLRSGSRDATYLRHKIVYDIQNHLGIPSLSANFSQLYINGEYIGLYIMMDCFKTSWIEYVYSEKDTTSLYKCTGFGNIPNIQSYMDKRTCTNENEDYTDRTEYNEFIRNLETARTIEDYEKFFDVDLFITQIALEYLLGSWDHFINGGNNIFLYKPRNGNDQRWKFLLYDFDADFGQDIIDEDKFNMIYQDLFNYTMENDQELFKPEISNNLFKPHKNDSIKHPYYSFEDYALHGYLLDALIFNHQELFENKLKELITKIFNPTILFPHIDSLKEFIEPYVRLDKTLNNEGIYPGKFDRKNNIYTYEQWRDNCEFTPVKNVVETNSGSYGIKYWILAKYRYICTVLHLDCDPNYMNISQ
ncbi:spore coat protein coth [Anaeromyces robustus]|uniref:Spore coat protein coth n=1 Tax=Anaeromyces robustus TaxID=1754192 RepID=A0A1Y1X3D0_9FUNG|nr:spore coat protein coth [Anaeromyces robustus]|eukprot:ORX80320.1 spore coat protein coth [Anaeromyces robustus]